MEPLELIIVLLCVLLGLGRGADLAFATDAATGLCTAGAVWWRYLALGAVVLAAVLAGRSRPLDFLFITHEENQSVERMRLHLFPGFFPVRQGMHFVLLQ